MLVTPKKRFFILEKSFIEILIFNSINERGNIHFFVVLRSFKSQKNDYFIHIIKNGIHSKRNKTNQNMETCEVKMIN